ncbi:MAG: redoxin domain-containing protein [Saprospiraceae bacterium]
MSTHNQRTILPQVGDPAPPFEAMSSKGLISFPAYCKDCWCVLFAHPANFTSAWYMYSTFLGLKERWFNQRNTKMLAVANEPIRQNEWSDKVRRYIGIYLHSPVIEDTDFRVSNLYGIANVRRKIPGFDRLAFIIDPDGVIRVALNYPLSSIEFALSELAVELDRLQGRKTFGSGVLDPLDPSNIVVETSDPEAARKPKAAYFSNTKINCN